MTTFEWITALTSVGALGLLAWSVFMLRAQLRGMTNAIEQSVVDTLDTLHTTTTQAFLQYPELRAVFNEGENGLQPEPMTRDTSLRAAAVAENLCDGMERAPGSEDQNMPHIAEALRAWIYDSFRYSKFLRTWLRERETWYAPILLEVLNDIEGELSSSAPQASPSGN